jgi:hypothetical protein
VGTVSSIDVQQALGGMDHPAPKEDIVEHAQDDGRGDDVVAALQGIEDRETKAPAGSARRCSTSGPLGSAP